MTTTSVIQAPGEQELRAFTPVREELRRLRALAGGPPARAIARDAAAEAGASVDSGAIAAILDGTEACSWPVLAAITIALDGDTGELRLMWAQWRMATAARPRGGSGAGHG